MQNNNCNILSVAKKKKKYYEVSTYSCWVDCITPKSLMCLIYNLRSSAWTLRSEPMQSTSPLPVEHLTAWELHRGRSVWSPGAAVCQPPTAALQPPLSQTASHAMEIQSDCEQRWAATRGWYSSECSALQCSRTSSYRRWSHTDSLQRRVNAVSHWVSATESRAISLVAKFSWTEPC